MQQILFVCNQYNCLFYIANILFFSVLLFNIFTPCLKFLTFTIFLKVSCFTRFCNHYQILMVVCHFLLYSFMLNCFLLLSECFVWPANHWTSNFIGKNIWRRSCLTSWLTDFHLIFFCQHSVSNICSLQVQVVFCQFEDLQAILACVTVNGLCRNA